MKKSVKRNVSVKIMAPAFLIAKIDRMTTGRSRAQTLAFLLRKGLIYLEAKSEGKEVGR